MSEPQNEAGLHQRARAYFGGMSPFVPLIAVAVIVVVLTVGERLGISFLLVASISVVGIAGYARHVARRGGQSLRESDLIPLVSGLVAAVIVGVSGLGFGGFGDRWGHESLFLAMVVATGVIVTVRTVRNAGRSAE